MSEFTFVTQVKMAVTMAFRYFVADVERSIEFYRSNLGFELVERWGPAFAILELEGDQLWLSGPGTSAMRPALDGRVPEPGGWNRLVVETRDLATLAARLETSGVVFRTRDVSGPGGGQALIDDPDGNPIELFQPRT